MIITAHVWLSYLRSEIVVDCPWIFRGLSMDCLWICLMLMSTCPEATPGDSCTIWVRGNMAVL